jgi:hypothetical protein
MSKVNLNQQEQSAMANKVQAAINQMYKRLSEEGAVLTNKINDDNGTVETPWAHKEHRYLTIKDPGCMPHIFHSYTTGVTFCGE